jgi:hypothetical protein
MKDRAVPHVLVLLHDRVPIRNRVDHAGILDVDAATQDEPPEVASEARARPDVASGTYDDFADQHGTGMYEGRGIDDGNDPVDCEDSRTAHPNASRSSLQGSMILRRPTPIRS